MTEPRVKTLRLEDTSKDKMMIMEPGRSPVRKSREVIEDGKANTAQKARSDRSSRASKRSSSGRSSRSRKKSQRSSSRSKSKGRQSSRSHRSKSSRRHRARSRRERKARAARRERRSRRREARMRRDLALYAEAESLEFTYQVYAYTFLIIQAILLVYSICICIMAYDVMVADRDFYIYGAVFQLLIFLFGIFCACSPYMVIRYFLAILYLSLAFAAAFDAYFYWERRDFCKDSSQSSSNTGALMGCLEEPGFFSTLRPAKSDKIAYLMIFACVYLLESILVFLACAYYEGSLDGLWNSSEGRRFLKRVAAHNKALASGKYDRSRRHRSKSSRRHRSRSSRRPSSSRTRSKKPAHGPTQVVSVACSQSPCSSKAQSTTGMTNEEKWYNYTIAKGGAMKTHSQTSVDGEIRTMPDGHIVAVHNKNITEKVTFEVPSTRAAVHGCPPKEREVCSPVEGPSKKIGELPPPRTYFATRDIPVNPTGSSTAAEQKIDPLMPPLQYLNELDKKNEEEAKRSQYHF